MLTTLPIFFTLVVAVYGDLVCHLHVAPPQPHSTGSLGSKSNPFPTITSAQLSLRANSALKAKTGPTRVCIHNGVYQETLQFSPSDSGASSNEPIIYLAAPGQQNVSVSGALPVSLQALPADDPARAYLSPAVAAQVVMADLVAAGVGNVSAANLWKPRGFGPYGGCQESPLELIIGTQVQRVARWPNVGDASQGTTEGFALTAWYAPTNGLSNSSMWANSLDTSAPWLKYKDLTTLQLHGFWHWEWMDGYVGIKNISSASEGGLVEVAFKEGGGEFEPTIGAARYLLTNALEALDEEGEYFVNSTSGKLYYFGPPTPSPPLVASVSLNSTLISVAAGTHDVWLAGFTIEASRGHGITLTGTQGIALLNLTLRNLGQDAINAYLSNDTLVSGVVVRDVGCGGVRFQGGGDRLTLTPSGNAVVDSDIARVERLCFTYNPAVTLDTGGVGAHNELHDTPHSCVALDGNDVVIMGNIIHNCSRWTFDNAAIYWYPTDWSKRNTSIRYNFFYGNAQVSGPQLQAQFFWRKLSRFFSPDPQFQHYTLFFPPHPPPLHPSGQDANTCNSATSCNRDVVYPDNGSAGVLVESNIMYHPRPPGSDLPCPHCQPLDKMTSYAVFEDGTRDCIKVNNILVLDGSNATFNGGAGVTWDGAQQGNGSAYLTELHAVGWNQGLFAQRYPALAALHDYWPAGGAVECAGDPQCGPAPWGNVLSTNVIVGAAEVFTPPPPQVTFPGQFNISNNLVTGGDPGWANADPRGTLNFTLSPSSPAWALGFVKIPSECFGPEHRCPGEPDWGAHQRWVLLSA